MRYQGKITSWKDEKGFGFITPNGGGDAVFVHIKSFVHRQKRPAGNDIVTYELRADAKGRVQAANVAFAVRRGAPVTAKGHNNRSLIAVAFLAFVAAAVLIGKLPLVILVFYLIASVIAFGAYALDKSAARRDEQRIRETTLQFFALLGGWPGALAAQGMLRHKTRKQSFQLVFWTTVVLNCSALGWLMSAAGQYLLRSIAGLL